MYDEIRMCVMHRVTHLPEQANRRFEVGSLLPAVLVDRYAVDVFHDEKRHVVIGGTSIEQHRDVRMLEIGQDLTFSHETAPEVIGCELGHQELDGDLLLELLVGPAGEIYETHAALRKLSLHGVSTDLFTDPAVWSC